MIASVCAPGGKLFLRNKGRQYNTFERKITLFGKKFCYVLVAYKKSDIYSVEAFVFARSVIAGNKSLFIHQHIIFGEAIFVVVHRDGGKHAFFLMKPDEFCKMNGRVIVAIQKQKCIVQHVCRVAYTRARIIL